MGASFASYMDQRSRGGRSASIEEWNSQAKVSRDGRWDRERARASWVRVPAPFRHLLPFVPHFSITVHYSGWLFTYKQDLLLCLAMQNCSFTFWSLALPPGLCSPHQAWGCSPEKVRPSGSLGLVPYHCGPWAEAPLPACPCAPVLQDGMPTDFRFSWGIRQLRRWPCHRSLPGSVFLVYH